MANNSWRISTPTGLHPISVAEGVSVRATVGQLEIDRAPGSPYVVHLDGDGLLQPQNLELSIIAKGKDLLDKHGALADLHRIRSIMRDANALWGEGPYEGFYIPLLKAEPGQEELRHPLGQYILPYTLVPASVEEGLIYDAWAYPILDDVPVEEASSAFHTQQSLANAPILEFSSASRWSAPVGFPKMNRGTMFVGGLTQEAATWSLGSIGNPPTGAGTPSAYGIGIFYSNGNYIAHVEGATLTVPQDNVAGFGYATFFALTWQENNYLSLYSMSRNGFRSHGSVALGAIQGLTQRRIWAGTRGDGVGVDGYVMPGAPRFGAPFLTHRIVPVEELRRALSPWAAHFFSFPELTTEPPPYGLELEIGDVPEVAVGKTVDVPVTLTKEGGYVGEVEWVTESPNTSLRLGVPYQQNEDSQEWFLPVTPEEGIAAGAYSVTITARAVGQATSDLLAGVIDTETFSITVRLGDPALVEGTTRFNALAAWQDKSFTTMWKNSVTGATGGVLVTRGLARQSARWDAAYGDGSNLSNFGGPSVIDCDAYVANMAADHYLQFAIPDAASWAVGTVFVTVSSQTNKFQYYQIYRGANGIQVRTSMGTTSANLVSPTNALPLVTGVMDIAVTVRAGGNLELSNPKGTAAFTTQARAWVGAGRLTLFGARLSDGTVQALSKACVLCVASGPVLPSAFQLERQAEFFRGYMLRTSAYERPEYPDTTYAIFLADAGNVLRNYHPATASHTMISKGAGATTSSGSFITNGADETGWRTGWITGSDASKPNDVIASFRDFSSSGGNGRNKFGISLYDSAASFIASTANGNVPRRFATWFNMSGQTSETETDTGGTIPMTGVQTYLHRLDPAGKRVVAAHTTTGTAQSATYDSWTATGRIQATIGAAHRGLSAGVVRGDSATGLEFEVQAECLGLVMIAKNTTAAEQAATAANITNTYDYSNVPLGSGGSGGGGVVVPPPDGGGGTVVVSPSDMSMVAIADADFNPTTLFGADGEQRTRWDRLKKWLDAGGIDQGTPPTIYRWDNTARAYRGQYGISRALSNFPRAFCFATATTKSLAWSRQAQRLWTRCEAVMDRNSAPWRKIASGSTHPYKGWGYGTKGGGEIVNYEGERIDLEAGVSAGLVAIAYLLNKNKHLDSSFQATINSVHDFYDNHHIPDWEAWHATGGGGLSARPLHARKNFTHAYLSEVQGAFCRAVNRSGALWYNDPLGVEALDGFALWNQNSVTQIVPTANFKDAAWASYGPARYWGQYVSPLKQQSALQFYQPSDYLSESIAIFVFLYMEGFLTRALGTQAAADTFMATIVSGVNLGYLPQPLVADKKWAANMAGSYQPATGSRTSWMFTGLPSAWDQTLRVEEAGSAGSLTWVIGALDASGRIPTIHNTWHASSPAAIAGKNGFIHGNIAHTFVHIYRNGRRD